jgi:hypothetical protein
VLPSAGGVELNIGVTTFPTDTHTELVRFEIDEGDIETARDGVVIEPEAEALLKVAEGAPDGLQEIAVAHQSSWPPNAS